MNIPDILRQMCQEELSDADIKSICRNRGFSSSEVKSRKFFENFLLSDIGISEAFKKLSKKEIIALHLMNVIKKAVDISFFNRLYGPSKKTRWHFHAFHKTHQETFKQVQNSFIRNGIILFAEYKQSPKKSKLERFCFLFPEIFSKSLPLPFQVNKNLTGKGILNESASRSKLSEIIINRLYKTNSSSQNYELRIDSEGTLLIGGKRFSLAMLKEWQIENFKRDVLSSHKIAVNGNNLPLISTYAALNYCMSLLEPDDWVCADELSSIFNIFCFEISPLDSKKVCELGWEWGFLLKYETEGKKYFRLPTDCKPVIDEISPEEYLQIDKDNKILVKMEIIPFKNLEMLSKISSFKITDSKFYASPSFSRINRFLNPISQDLVLKWLKDNSIEYAHLIEKVEQQWGKKIVHQNLLIAKIKDLTLKVAIQKAFSESDKIIFLSKNFIAFPKEFLSEIESQVLSAGYVIKKVEDK